MLQLNERSSLSYSPWQHWYSRAKTSQNLLEKGNEVVWGEWNTYVQSSSFRDKIPSPRMMQGPLTLAYWPECIYQVPSSLALGSWLVFETAFFSYDHSRKKICWVYIVFLQEDLLSYWLFLFLFYLFQPKNLLNLSRARNLSLKSERRIVTQTTFLFLKKARAGVKGKWDKTYLGLWSQSKKKKNLKMLSALICFGQTPVGHCTVRGTQLKRLSRGLELEGWVNLKP